MEARDLTSSDNAFEDGSGGDDVDGSPTMIVRLPPDDSQQQQQQHRMNPSPYGPGGPNPHHPHSPTVGAPGVQMGPRINYGPPNGAGIPGPYGYDDPSQQQQQQHPQHPPQYPYYGSNGSAPPPPQQRLWNGAAPHDPTRSPYEAPRSASTAGYSPVNEEGQPWGNTGRQQPGLPSTLPPSWQQQQQQQPSQQGGGTLPGQPITLNAAGRSLPPRTSADNSPIQPSNDLAFRGVNVNGRAPPMPGAQQQQPGGPGGRYGPMNPGLYPPGGISGGPRGNSPPQYNSNGGYPYHHSAPGANGVPLHHHNPAAAASRSPGLPGISTMDHHGGGGGGGYPQQQPSPSNGYSPMLPRLGPPTGTPTSATSGEGGGGRNVPPYPSPRDTPGSILSAGGNGSSEKDGHGVHGKENGLGSPEKIAEIGEYFDSSLIRRGEPAV